MVGMLQILTWMFAFYIVLKGLEILQISLASAREGRIGMIIWSVILLVICVLAAVFFVTQQETMAHQVSSGIGGIQGG